MLKSWSVYIVEVNDFGRKWPGQQTEEHLGELVALLLGGSGLLAWESLYFTDASVLCGVGGVQGTSGLLTTQPAHALNTRHEMP